MEKEQGIGEKEAQLWNELVEKFDDEERHKKYIKYCLQNNLIGKAVKRYGEYADDKEKYPIELRRIAHTKHEQLTSVIMIGTKVGLETEKKAKFSLVDILSLVLVMLLFFGAIFLESWWVFFLFLITFGGFLAYKYFQISKKLGRGV